MGTVTSYPKLHGSSWKSGSWTTNPKPRSRDSPLVTGLVSWLPCTNSRVSLAPAPAPWATFAPRPWLMLLLPLASGHKVYQFHECSLNQVDCALTRKGGWSHFESGRAPEGNSRTLRCLTCVFVPIREVHLPQGRCGSVLGSQLKVKSRLWLFTHRPC